MKTVRFLSLNLMYYITYIIFHRNSKAYKRKLCLMRLAALKAVEAGVEGIVVSNHGGRQLDYSPATITVLEEVINSSKLALEQDQDEFLNEQTGLLLKL